MSDIQRISTGYISPYSDYGLRNSQALGGVSHLWQDFFAQALADQLGDAATVSDNTFALPADRSIEPGGGKDVLALIVDQRHCDVQDTEILPPEPLFLPIAEFEMDLLDRKAPPYPDDEIVAQQKQQNFESGWVRPLVLTAGQPIPEPGPAPEPRPLHLPIAEFELELLDKPRVPFEPEELADQQRHMDYDLGWARPLILHNLRIAA